MTEATSPRRLTAQRKLELYLATRAPDAPIGEILRHPAQRGHDAHALCHRHAGARVDQVTRGAVGNGQVTKLVIEGKGGKPRVAQLSEEAQRAIRQYLAPRDQAYATEPDRAAEDPQVVRMEMRRRVVMGRSDAVKTRHPPALSHLLSWRDW